MSVSKFENLHAWQQARTLTKQTYQICQETRLKRDFGLKDQIQRAAISTMANIAEGFDCNSRTEFKRFLGYARRSAVEIQSLLYICADAGYLSPIEFKDNYEQAEKTKAYISALMASLKTSL